LVVSTIHNNSARRDQPLTILDCATISDAEFSAQLFHDGGGTLDLRDVDQLSPPMQARVAQALAAQRTRGGGSRLTVRMVATAGSDLSDAAASGTFSRSLYDELAVITIRMPPLRDRHQDIPLLVRYFIQRFNAELSRSVRGVDDQVASALAEYPWPGNVAQLERVIKRACIVTRSQIITMDDLGDTLGEVRMSGSPDSHGSLARALRTVLHDRLVQKGGSESVYHDIVDRVETALVEEALTITNGNQVKAAEILGVNRATLKKKMPSG
jgi:DNA-binding NtrC family response regulator